VATLFFWTEGTSLRPKNEAQPPISTCLQKIIQIFLPVPEAWFLMEL
jgi:hypothetical protein